MNTSARTIKPMPTKPQALKILLVIEPPDNQKIFNTKKNRVVKNMKSPATISIEKKNDNIFKNVVGFGIISSLIVSTSY